MHLLLGNDLKLHGRQTTAIAAHRSRGERQGRGGRVGQWDMGGPRRSGSMGGGSRVEREVKWSGASGAARRGGLEQCGAVAGGGGGACARVCD